MLISSALKSCNETFKKLGKKKKKKEARQKNWWGGKEITINKKYNPRKQYFLICSLLSNNSNIETLENFQICTKIIHKDVTLILN